MPMKEQGRALEELAVREGAYATGWTDVSAIPFRRDFRCACAANHCGHYGSSWMCPPDIGDIDEMIERAKGYRRAFVFQTVGPLEDSYDFEGMDDAAECHTSLMLQLLDRAKELEPDTLAIGAGYCRTCGRCAKLDNQPCRLPDRAVSSLEAYGIAVSELAPQCGMRYINGENTVTYFGAFLFHEEEL